MKLLIIGVIAAFFLYWGVWPYFGESEKYWSNVGPTWDRILNPCKYEVCE